MGEWRNAKTQTDGKPALPVLPEWFPGLEV